MSDIKAGDTVRVLGPHGNTVATGLVLGFTSRDRSHVSSRVKARAEAVVQTPDGVKTPYPLARLRKVKPSDG